MSKGPRATVLVVDDDTFVRVLLRDALHALAEDPRVVEAQDGAEALAAFDECSPQLVFLDLLMPKMSGMEALVLLRKKSPDVPIVVVSSMETESMVREALAAGATGFIGKPFHPDEIAAVVAKALRSSHG